MEQKREIWKRRSCTNSVSCNKGSTGSVQMDQDGKIEDRRSKAQNFFVGKNEVYSVSNGLKMVWMTGKYE